MQVWGWSGRGGVVLIYRKRRERSQRQQACYQCKNIGMAIPIALLSLLALLTPSVSRKLEGIFALPCAGAVFWSDLWQVQPGAASFLLKGTSSESHPLIQGNTRLACSPCFNPKVLPPSYCQYCSDTFPGGIKEYYMTGVTDDLVIFRRSAALMPLQRQSLCVTMGSIVSCVLTASPVTRASSSVATCSSAAIILLLHGLLRVRVSALLACDARPNRVHDM